MSKTTGGSNIVSRYTNHILFKLKLKPSRKALALAIANSCSYETGVGCIRSISSLMYSSGIGAESTFKSSIDDLIRMGLVSRCEIKEVPRSILPAGCTKTQGYFYAIKMPDDSCPLKALLSKSPPQNQGGKNDPLKSGADLRSANNSSSTTKEQESSQPARARTHEGESHEQSDRASTRRDSDDRGRDPRGDDPHSSAHPLPDVHPSADARGGDAPSPTHRAEDEGRLTPDRRYRIAYDLAQFVLAANEDRPVGQQLGASFTMLEPAMLSFVKHVEARVSSERVEDVAGQCIRAVVHAERLKFLEMWAREALDDVLAEKAPAVSRAPRRAPSSSRLPQPGSSFEEEEDWSAKYKRAFDLAKEAQQ